MPTYEVEYTRTETITYRLEAVDPTDAENRFLTDGEELGSKLGHTHTEVHPSSPTNDNPGTPR